MTTSSSGGAKSGSKILSLTNISCCPFYLKTNKKMFCIQSTGPISLDLHVCVLCFVVISYLTNILKETGSRWVLDVFIPSVVILDADWSIVQMTPGGPAG